jgi:hypothetical protein
MDTHILFTLTVAGLGLVATACDAPDDASSATAQCDGGKCDGATEEATTEQRALAVLGHYEGLRASAQEGAEPGFIDFTKLDATRRGIFSINGFFPPHSDAEGDNVPQADLFHIIYELTPEHYEALFGLDSGAVSFDEADFETFIYEQRAQAEPLPEGGRRITLQWHNASREDTRRAQLDLEVDPFGDLIRVHMTKQAKKRCLFVLSCGWDVVFDDELADPERTASGLALRTDGHEIGRAHTRDEIRSAVDDPTISNFHDIVEAQ